MEDPNVIVDEIDKHDIEETESAGIVVDDAPAAPPAQGEKPPRRPKGMLEDMLVEACNAFVTGQLDLGDRVCVTPALAAAAIADAESAAAAAAGEPPKYGPVSAGAITNLFKKWQGCGYATMTDGPYGFVSYTSSAYEDDVACADDLIRKQRAAEKAAAAPAQ